MQRRIPIIQEASFRIIKYDLLCVCNENIGNVAVGH